MNESAEILFISDLHLDPNKPEITENFLLFIKTRAVKARVLYILGDLFEVWLGDDDEAPEFEPVCSALQHLSRTVDIYFIHGNRDFLIGQSFARRTGMTVIDEPTILTLGTRQIGLMHGDLLCTDDVDYQKFRQSVRNRQWQQQFLAQSLAERKAIAASLREKSTRAMTQKDLVIMDVNQHTVVEYFEKMDIDILIHGHTHRPGIHKVSSTRRRIVLGDWNPHISYLSLQDDHFKLVDRRIKF